jgi:hypothetical protein
MMSHQENSWDGIASKCRSILTHGLNYSGKKVSQSTTILMLLTGVQILEKSSDLRITVDRGFFIDHEK